MRRPSSKNSSATGHVSSWPTIGCQLLVSHTRTVLSLPPDTICRPSGLNPHFTAAACPRRTPISLRCRVPQPDGLVIAAGGDAGAVGAERHTCHPAVVAQRLPDRAPGGAYPTTGRSCLAGGGDPGAVGAEGHTRSPVRRGAAAARSAARSPCPTTGRSCRSWPEAMRVPSGLNATLPAHEPHGRAAVPRSAVRWPRPTTVRSCRRRRRRCGCRRG